MPSVNNGPAVLTTQQSIAAITPANANQGTFPQAGNGLRLIATFKNMPVSGLGDVQLPVINSTKWVPTTVAFTNSRVLGVSGTTAAATLSVNSGPAVTGTSIRGSAALTGVVNSTFFLVAAAATLNTVITSQTVYVNVTVAVAGGTVDVLVYGYDVSDYTP